MLKKASPPLPMSSSVSSDAHGPLRSAATVIPPVLVSANPSTEVMMVQSLGSTVVQPRLSGDYWRGDIF
jgi:hypothetical protein